MTNQLPPFDIQQRIFELERRDLEGAVPLSSPMLPTPQPFVRVLGQAAFWRQSESSGYEQRMEDLLTSAHGQGCTFYYVVISHGYRLGIYLALGGQHSEALLRTMLTGAYPGIQLKEAADILSDHSLQQMNFLVSLGRLTGIPSRKVASASSSKSQERTGPAVAGERSQSGQFVAQLERLVRGLKGATWGYCVRAVPYVHSNAVTEFYTCLKEIEVVSALSKRQLQELYQTMRQIDPTTQAGETRSVSGEIVNREAQYCVELLERRLARLDEGKAVGMWDVEAYFFASDESTLQRAQALLRAVFAGVDSRPEPIRTFACGKQGLPSSRFATRLTSTEVGTLVQLPREEVPGYHITDYAAFDLDLEPTPASASVTIGTISDGGSDTKLPYFLSIADFAKHGLVTGVTGSGKTTTIFALLDALWNKGKSGGVPFLVLEPAKAEYRALRGTAQSNGSGNGPIPELRVYTLGDETISPFRLNPFEFEIVDANHAVHVQTHIDYLKAVFNAAFILYAPMPYILEVCLHEVYQDKGWDLTSSRNRRLPPALWGQASQWPVFPTLADLYHKVDEVTERLGYEERIKMDVKAGLQARIGSLLLGGKGLMLNTSRSIPMSELLSYPTVLELDRIGNDDEKAFLMGLIFTRLYEFRRVQASTVSQAPSFQHLVVVEEAHRLLKNVPTEVETEASNVKGHAVETFTNILSEIRAYGQGLLIAEQIPSKLAPDAIKNTNLKIVHRLVAEDDRHALASTTNMDQGQERYLISLPPGRAAVYNEGADHPYLVQMSDYSQIRTSNRPQDQNIAVGMRSLTKSELYDPVPEYSYYVPRSSHLHIQTEIDETAQAIINRPDFHELWYGFFLNVALHPHTITSLGPINDQITKALINSKAPHEAVTAAVLVRATYTSLHEHGRMYGWTFDMITSMQRPLIGGLIAVVGQNYSQGRVLLTSFSDAYRQASARLQGPFIGCDVCSAKCLYRRTANVMLSDANFQHLWQTSLRETETTRVFDELASANHQAALHLVGNLDPSTTIGVALCISAQMTARRNTSRRWQSQVAQEIANRLR